MEIDFNTLLKQDLLLLRDKPEYKDLYKQVLIAFAQTTKWQRELTQDEAQSFVEFIHSKI